MKKIALSATILLFGLLNAHGQYMSFFGDSTWKYNLTYITSPPENYLNFPPNSPSPLGVYCQTLRACYWKDHQDSYGYYYHDVCDDYPEGPGWAWGTGWPLNEDTVFGRLYNGDFLMCDMSLSEGDTFVLTGLCGGYYHPVYWPYLHPDTVYQTDMIHVKMITDSIRYLFDKKTIFLSLLDHQNDYFFGTGNTGYSSNYHFTIRFIEGIGPTYGQLTPCEYAHFDTNGQVTGHDVYLAPWLGLLQCMYKDDSLVYLAHESLECDQTCMGLTEYPQSIINLYPNPATQYVVLDLSTGEEMFGVVVIMDMLGRQCLQQKVEGTKCQISVSDLPVGMYFLSYTDGNRKVTKKFLKE